MTNMRGTCPNIPYGVSFHNADGKNSFYSMIGKGCFDGQRDLKKNRQKRALIKWVKCGPVICYTYLGASFIGLVSSLVLSAMYL